MFGKLKNKLKSWFKKSEEKAEEETEKQEIEQAEKQIEELKEEKKEKGKKIVEPPMKFEVGKHKFEPDLEQLKEKEEELEELKKIREEKKEAKEEKPKEGKKKGILEKIGLKKKFTIKGQYFNEIFESLELILLENNVAMKAVEKIKKDLKQELVNTEVDKNKVDEKIKEALKISLDSLFVETLDLIEKIKQKKQEKEKRPFVIVFFGINGSGKTTTIAKIAHLLKKNNISSVLAASDTFRAASIEQLTKHGDKLGLETIKQKYGSDPSAVAFDAIKHAEAKEIDVILVDTAGRMYTKQDLMREMEKICRVTSPDLKIFVAEAITGNDAVEQAQTFNNAVGIDGIILTKADIDNKGGASISIGHVTGRPILFLGTGQEYSELEKFDKDKLISSLGL